MKEIKTEIVTVHKDRLKVVSFDDLSISELEGVIVLYEFIKTSGQIQPGYESRFEMKLAGAKRAMEIKLHELELVSL